MNRILIFMLASLAASGLAVPAQAVESASRGEYAAFRVISERNIFNANRSSRSSGRTSSREPERRVRTETFTLVGTMSYEKGRFAFFDGSSSQFRKVLQSEESIAGFKVAEVAPACVKLQTTNGQILELCVGMQRKKREDEEWQLAGRVESSEVAGSGSASGGQTSSSAGDPDVLKKLMERREQEGGVASDTSTQPALEADTKAAEPKDAGSSGETDEVLKRLLQKREQELNK